MIMEMKISYGKEDMKRATLRERGSSMEAIRKYIDASSLMTVMSLPETFKNRKLEVLIFPTEEQKPEKADIESVVQSLIGAIPATDLSLAEMQEERRHKYETAD